MILAESVRQWLLREPNDRISEDENLRTVCSPLDRLLGELLSTSDGWSRYHFLDGILPCTAEKLSPDDLFLTGLVVWIGDGGREWKEPLSANLRVSDALPSKIRYELRFADADRGLGTCPYGTPHDFPYVPVTNWMFTFRSTASGMAIL
jgi:hypothetical protein